MVCHSPRPRRDVGLRSDRLCADVADAAIRPVAPGPAPAHVQHADLVTEFKLGQLLGLIVSIAQQDCVTCQVANQGVRIMRRDHLPGEGSVGQILAIGVGQRVGRM